MNKEKKALSIQEEQNIQYEILKIFDSMCKDCGIKFFLAYGTLLGAVRDKGFIEWDDDIDLWVYREDLKRIKEQFYNYFDSKIYFFQDIFTDPYCMSPEMSRICVNDTYKWAEGNENERFHTGIYFDLFPLDNGLGDERDCDNVKKFAKKHNLLTAQLKTNKTESIRSSIIRKCIRMVPRKIVTSYVMSTINSYVQNPRSQHLISFPASYAGTNRAVFETRFFESTINMQFEDLMLPCPSCYDELLEYMYGSDYMTPRVTKPSIIHGVAYEKRLIKDTYKA